MKMHMKILKNLTSLRNVFFAALLTGSFASLAMASPVTSNEEKTDKVTLKTRDAVSNAAPDDWYTYAESASKCIKKGVNLNEANEWLRKSLEIKETAYNLSVMGDYYIANRLPNEALKYYVKSIEAGKNEDPDFNASEIQGKIAKIVFK